MTNLMPENPINTNGASADGASDAALSAVAPNPNIGSVRPANIVDEMQTAYLDYAMSVIVARALPDVRDGLKPVHRRILYAMAHDLYLTHDKPHRKSARIVGEVLGKYHPHGDVAVYDAMVRMAQDFSLRYPLIDGQGNFGSIDGDGAAAMRYTEARLAEISTLMLADLDKDTVDWHDNFDNSLQEPDILPAALPNLLVNGASGIAVGMATNIPPHNLGEVVDALVYVIDNYARLEELTVEDLMQFIKGPDFPTGGILYRYREDGKVEEQTDAIAQGYSVGRSRLILQAKAHFEEMSRGRMRIVVTELPYQTNKTALIERIAALTRDGKLEGITDLRDESDRTGMRIVIELNRNTDPKATLKDLFKYTPLQQTFGLQMLALMDGQPRMLSLKRVLAAFIQHRQEIIRRRSEFDLQRARDRAHIVEGLLRALDILDEVIDTIRRSQNVETARNNLMKNFKFTQIQAQAILDMQLRRLAALERKKLKDEYDELLARIAYLEDLLAHPEKILAVIRADLLEQKEKYGDARRTQIVDRTKGTLTTTDLLPQQDVWVTVSATGDLRRQDLSRLNVATLRKLGKAGQVAILNANTRDWLYLFARDGRCTRVAIHEIPQDGNPKHVADLTEFTRRDQITAAITLPRLEGEAAAGYLFFATAQGLVKRVTLADFLAPVGGDVATMAIEEKDRLDWVLVTNGQQEVMLVTATGQSIRFSEAEVRSMGLAAGGVGGIKLQKKDLVVYAAVVEPEGSLVTMTARGFAKRTPLSEYSSQGRNGSGIVTHKPTDRTGEVAAALMLPPAIKAEEMLVAVTVKQAVKSITLADIPAMGRGVQGKAVIEELGNDQVATLLRAQDEPEPPGFESKGGASTLPTAPAAAPTSPQPASAPGATQAKATAKPRQPATASKPGKGTTPVMTGMTKLKPAPPAPRSTAAVTPEPTPAAKPAASSSTATGPVATPPPAAARASNERATRELSAKATKPVAATTTPPATAPKPLLLQPKPKADKQQAATKAAPPGVKRQATAKGGISPAPPTGPLPAANNKPATTKAAATSPPAPQTPRKSATATAPREEPTAAKATAPKTTSPPVSRKRSPQATAAPSPGKATAEVSQERTIGSTTARRARGKPTAAGTDAAPAKQAASQQEALVPAAVASSAAATPKPTAPRGTPKQRPAPAPDQPRTLELFPAEQSADAPAAVTKGSRKAKGAPTSTKPAKMRKLQVAVSVPNTKRK